MRTVHPLSDLQLGEAFQILGLVGGHHLVPLLRTGGVGLEAAYR
jgi:hypothetical protein